MVFSTTAVKGGGWVIGVIRDISTTAVKGGGCLDTGNGEGSSPMATIGSSLVPYNVWIIRVVRGYEGEVMAQIE